MTESMKLKMTKRAEALFNEQSNLIHCKTDRLFGVLLVFEYFAGILIALIVSPNVWAGQYSAVHIHVLVSIFLGGLIVFWPVYLALRHPGKAVTRHVIAVGQMLYSALLIHLTGGRIETHFHVFGSLAFISFYRDWRVLVSATVVVAADHVLRGIIYPQSVYGINAIEPWRWLEHSWWVIFEDFFLINACLENCFEMRENAFRQAEVEVTRDGVEELVCDRTKQLQMSELRVATQLAATRTLSDASSLEDAAPLLLGRIADGLFHNAGLVLGAMWEVNGETEQFKQISEIQLCAARGSEAAQAPIEMIANFNGLALAERASKAESIVKETYSLDAHSTGTVFAVPIVAGRKVCGVFEFFVHENYELNDLEIALLDSLARQIGQFTERRKIEHNNKQLAHIVQSSSEAIIAATLDGVITSWNGGAERLLGYTLAEVNGKDETMLVPEARIDEFREHVQTVADSKESKTTETIRISKDGREVDVAVARFPVYDEHNRIVGNSVFMRDIAEKKEAEKRVSEFYSIVSHELRTPLTSIRGALGLIEGGIITPDSPQMMELVTVARSSSDRLIRLINDMLDLKKIEAGKMEMCDAKISAHDIVKSTVHALSGLAQETSVSVKCAINADHTFSGDWDKLTQVLTNLGSNAVKFSPPGSVVTFDAHLVNNDRLRFTIADQGCGIAAEHRDKLFEKFQQIDSSDTRQKGGTGLGLAICKALVTQHKGTIGFDSAVGVGSTFWFELPVIAKNTVTANPKPISQKVPERMTGHVLLVEDDDELATVIGAVIKQQGYQFTRAARLSQARELLTEMVPDVVILDLTLPDGNGLDFLEYMRSNPETVDIPVIISTGQQVQKKTVGNAAIVDWLMKPFDNSRLTASVERALRYPGKCKVLVVDDDSDTRMVLSAQLRSAGLDCIEAKDGLEAIYLTRKEAPDLIVLDVQMPHVDGFKVVEVLKNEDARSTPLVIYSGRDLTAAERKSLTLGVTKHLMKGQNQWELSSAINELLTGVLDRDADSAKSGLAADAKVLVNAVPGSAA